MAPEAFPYKTAAGSTYDSGRYGEALTRDAIELARLRAAELLEANVDDVVFDRPTAQFHVVGTPARALGWQDLGGIEVTHRFKPAGGAGSFAFGACVAMVEVDTETGLVTVAKLVSVDDCGTILQPALAEGQVHGGLGVAVAAALCEEMAYDEAGNPRTANFADYALISAAEMPWFECHEMETPSPLNPLGVKGVGEPGPSPRKRCGRRSATPRRETPSRT